MFSALADPGNQAKRHGHADRARARDNEHRHRRHHGIGQGRARRAPGAKGEPSHEGQDGDDHHRGRKVAGHYIDQPGDGGFGPHRVLYQLDDLGEGGVFAHLGGAEFEAAGGVDGRADDLIAHLLVYRQTLAGDHRLVHCRAAFDDLAVYGNLAARPHHHHIAHQHTFYWDLDLQTIPHHVRGLGLQADQRADRLAGLTFGAHFQRLAEHD